MTATGDTELATAPLSFAQERLWLIDRAAPGSPVYNVPLLTRWHEPVDPDVLASALTAVVTRHEVLRTTYHLRDGQPVQVVGAPGPVQVEVLDAGPSVDAEVADRARRPFDLATGPVLRATVWRGVRGGDLMLLVVHHIAVDGWSLAPLYADLADAYRGVALPELSPRYIDFAVVDRAGLDESQVAARAAELLDTEPFALACARPTRPRVDRPGEQVTFALPAGVEELARALRVTPFVVLHAAFQAVLAHRSGRERFVIGVVTANRRQDVAGLVGFFVNTVPVRCLVSPEWTFRELCRRTRAEAYGSLTHQWIPYDRLTAELTAAGGRHQLVEVAFVLQNMPAPDPQARWAPPVVLPTGTAKFDLLLILEQTPDGMTGIVEYDTDRYPAEVAEAFAADYRDLLTRVTTDPDLPPRQAFRGAAPTGERPAKAQAVPVRATTSAARLARAVELFEQAFVELGGPRERIEPESNFFRLGGHSLLAVTMLARAGRVSPRDFFADPTVGGLARLLTDAATSEEPVAAELDRYPVTSTQQRFWFLDRLPALRAAYLMPTVLELTGQVDRDALREATDRALARHPALRSRFELDRKSRTVFYRTDGPPAVCTTTDASTWDPARLREHLAGLCWTGFDLATDPPVRAEILAVAADRTLLVLVPHHIVADGWSRTLLLNEIAGAEPADAVHPGRLRQDTRAAADLVARLADAPTDVALPHDRERPPVQSTLAASTSRLLGQELSARLRAVAAEHECTTFLVTAALLAVTLARRGRQRDFLFAFPWGGRDAPDAMRAVAMLVNTVVLRVDLRGANTWRDVLARVRDAGAVAFGNADVPFDEVVAALHPDRDLSRPPITPVFLSASDGADVPPDFGAGVLARYLPLDPLHVKYELEVTAADRPEGVELTLAYATALFDQTTVEALAADLHATAVALATSQDSHPLNSTKETART